MLENIPVAPPDAIFGLNEAFKNDPRPDKTNLVAGVYQDEDGKTPIFAAVREAERRLFEDAPSKVYLPIDGDPAFLRHAAGLLCGEGSRLVEEGRTVTVQTVGGTGALRVAGDFLHRHRPDATLWLSDPTWPNHPQIYDAAGVKVESYPYYDRHTCRLDRDGFLTALGQVRAGDVVLLHGPCHNPTGVDPSQGDWGAIGDVLAQRGALPLVDFAYQGFARGFEEDAEWLHVLCGKVPELFVCTSFSKNFGLYNERLGALTAVTATPAAARAVRSQLKSALRAGTSNPPAHGARVVTTILDDAELRRSWSAELDGMRERIKRLRRLFADGLDQRGVRLREDGNDFIVRQNGMFSFSGLTPEEVERLRDDAAIYMVGSGRINVAGMSEAKMDGLLDAIAATLVPA